MRNKDVNKLRENAEATAKMLRACANAERLMILCNLVAGEQSVGVLLENSDLSQSAFSQHLAVLREDGLVKTRKESQVVYYSISDDRIVELLQLLQKLYC